MPSIGMSPKIPGETQPVGRVVHIGLCALTMAVAAIGASCGDERQETAKKDEAPIADKAAGEAAWLGLADDDLPEEWLVRRKANTGAAVDPRAVEAARTLLERASTRFSDQPRMIANRAAQLEEMLAEKGHSEDATTLIEGLLRAAGGSKPTGGFASLCQYYFNLRAQGLDRDQAIDALAKLYGS